MAETETLSAPVTAEAVCGTIEDGQKNGGVPSSELNEALAKLEKQQDEEKTTVGKQDEEDMVEDGQDNDADTSREQVDYANGHKNGSTKRKNRRNRRGGKHHSKKNWKPYSRLSWDERKKVDERETARASRKMDERSKSGLPMAPYNTTQFIMDDQDQPSPVVPDDHNHNKEANKDRDRNSRDGRDDASGSYDSSDGEFYDSPSDEDTFLEKQFSEAYESFHAERLQGLSKEDLVREYIELETKNEKLEKEIKVNRNDSRNSSDRDSRLPSEESVNITQVTSLEEEIRKLKEDNARLCRENEFLAAAAGKLTE